MKFMSAHNRGEIYENKIEDDQEGEILLIRNWDSMCTIFYTSFTVDGYGRIRYLGIYNYPKTLKIIKNNDKQNAIYKLNKLLDQEREN